MDDLNHELGAADESDSAVRKWGAAKTFRPAELQQLSAAIYVRIGGDGELVKPCVRGNSKVAIYVAAALSVAAAAVIAVVCFRLQPVNRDGDLLQAATLPQERLEVLARESTRLFDHRLIWLAETNQDLLLGLDESASPATDQQQISVRVVVFHRNSRSQAWQPVFTTNVVTREEEVVDLQNSAQGPHLRLWTHILPDQSVAVDTDLSMGSGSAPHWSTTSVLSPTTPAAVVKAADGPGEYQVWQAATIMVADDGL